MNLKKAVLVFLENKIQYITTQMNPVINPDHGPLLKVKPKTDSWVPIINEEIMRKIL